MVPQVQVVLVTIPAVLDAEEEPAVSDEELVLEEAPAEAALGEVVLPVEVLAAQKQVVVAAPVVALVQIPAAQERVVQTEEAVPVVAVLVLSAQQSTHSLLNWRPGVKRRTNPTIIRS